MSGNSESAKVLEELLLIKSQQGDRKALSLLVKKWHPKVVRHAQFIVHDHEAAQDIAQECWHSVVKGLSRLQDPSRFGSWILRITHNKAIDWIRKNKKEPEEELLEVYKDTGETDLPELSSEMTEVEKVKKILTILPDQHRLILTLFYLEEQSLKDISRILSLPKGTVKSRLFYARELLKKKYKEVHHEKI